MTEIVQRNTENMVRELEDLRQTKLFSEDMIRRIIIARKHMESKIYVNFSKNVDDYKNYIQHEVLILEKVRKSRDKMRVSDKKNSIDLSIIKRIRRLYELALQRFTSDYSLHVGFFKFCKENVFNATASQAIANMIKQFAYQPEVWKLAADWYCQINDIQKAEQMYQKGLTFNSKSTLLYTSAIKLELTLMMKKETGNENEVNKKEKCCEIIDTYIELMLKDIKNLEFIITILEILEKHQGTILIQKRLLEYLYQNHSSEELVWHTLAKRELNGLHFETNEENHQISSSISAHLLKNCIHKYKQGLYFVGLNKKKKLWSHCLETLIKLKEKNAFTEVGECLRTSLQEAHTDIVLEERYYSIWVSIIPDEDARKILMEATDIYPQSEELWKLRLKYAITTNVVKQVDSVFYLGLQALKEKALNLWLMLLRFHLLVSDDEQMVIIFEDGIKQPSEISNVLKPRYIQWIDFHKGTEAARKRYRAIARSKPYCKELHLTMSRLESSQIVIDNQSWGEVHELACKQFGETDPDVWTSYIRFLLFVKPDNFIEHVNKVRSDAKENLPGLMWQQFNEACEKLMTEY